MAQPGGTLPRRRRRTLEVTNIRWPATRWSMAQLGVRAQAAAKARIESGEFGKAIYRGTFVPPTFTHSEVRTLAGLRKAITATYRHMYREGRLRLAKVTLIRRIPGTLKYRSKDYEMRAIGSSLRRDSFLQRIAREVQRRRNLGPNPFGGKGAFRGRGHGWRKYLSKTKVLSFKGGS